MMEHTADNAKQDGRSPSQGSSARRTPAEERPLHPVLQLQREAGNQAVLALQRSGVIQAKLAISEPNEPEEKQADQTADRVVSSASTDTIEHSSPDGATGGVVSPKREEDENFRREETAAHAVQHSPAAQAPVAALGAGGQPLPPSVLSFFEPRFGRSFGDVRVHTDNAAAESARLIRARAFTTGRDVVFGAGEYAPHTTEGNRLLAHELTHVVQQRASGTMGRIQRRLEPMTSVSETSEPSSEEKSQASEFSEAAQHMFRQYPRLFDALTLAQWNQLVAAAEARAANQEAQQTVSEAASTSIQVTLNQILDPAARFVDVDIWDTVFGLFYNGDQSLTAGILLRNEIARQWFKSNAVDPQREQVTIFLIDPQGLESGPAQLDFHWRNNSINDSLGAIEVEWLDEPLGARIMVLPLRDARAEVSRDGRELAEAAALKREKEQLEQKLPPVIAKARATPAKATLAEIEMYRKFVAERAERAYAIDQRPRASSYVPGIYTFYKENSLALFELVGQMKDWRLGKVQFVDLDLEGPEALAQVHVPTERETQIQLGFPVRDVSEPERLYAEGQISLQGMNDLLQAEADRIFISSLVNIALSFATLGFGAWVAEGIGLAEGTLGYSVVQFGVSGATTEVGTKAAEHIITKLKTLEDPTAQAIWAQGAPSLGDYFKAAGLGFIKGAALPLVLGGAVAAWRGYSAWRAARIPGTGAGISEEPPFTVLSDIMDAQTNVRTWQLRTVDGHLVTISAHAETGSGYIWNAATGELRQIINGELGGAVQMLREGSQAGAPLLLTAATEHTEILAQLDELLARGPIVATRSPEVLARAVTAFRQGTATADDIEIIFSEIVEDYRATRLIGTTQATREGVLPGVLNYRGLTDCCGQGRDITAASLSTIVRESGQTAVLRRYQALDLFEHFGERHAFSIVEFEGLPGELYLVDPTFAQFLKPGMFGKGGPLFAEFVHPEMVGPEGIFTGNILKTDLAGARFARDLVRDGFVRLTPENARLYVQAMGVPEPMVENMTARLLEGERALLTERIGGPTGTGIITEAQFEGPNFANVAEVEEETLRLIGIAEAAGDPLRQLPRLRDLAHRLHEALQAGAVPWSVEQHGPWYRP